MTTAVIAMMALSTPLYATGDMDKSTQKNDKANVTMDQQQEKDMAMDKQHNKDMAMDDQSMNKDRVGTVPTADELRGMDVYSQQGEEIGEIEEVATNDQNGEIKFVVLSRGGILGIGDEDIALPLAALTFQDDRATLTVDTSKLENAPQQANASDDQFQRDLQSHYGVSPAWNQDASKSMDKEKTSMKDKMGDDSTSPDLKSENILDDSEKKKSDY